MDCCLELIGKRQKKVINKKTGDQNELYEVLGDFTVNFIKLF